MQWTRWGFRHTTIQMSTFMNETVDAAAALAVLRILLPFHLKLVKSGAIFVLEVEQRRDLKSSRS